MPNGEDDGSTFDKVTDWLEGVIKDITTLDVVTFSGTLTVEPATEGEFKVSELYDKLRGSIGDESKLKLIALTHIDLDFDVTTFMANKLSSDEKELITYHVSTVEASQNARSSVVELALDVIGR